MGEEDNALRTAHEIMAIWGKISDEQTEGSDNNLAQLPTDQASVSRSLGYDLDTESLMASSIAQSRRILGSSEVDSSLIDTKGDTLHGTDFSNAWILVAEVFLACNRLEEAELCLIEASHTKPYALLMLYMRGRICEHTSDYEQAASYFKQALSIDPFHLQVNEHLAEVHLKMGNKALAEKLIRFALSLNFKSHALWNNLADIVEEDGNFDESIQCRTLALHLENSSPVVPFSTLDFKL